MVPISETKASNIFELQLLRQISSQMVAHQELSLRMQESVQDVRERVIRIESSGTGARLDALKEASAVLSARLDRLEDDHQQRKGAVAFLGWLSKNAPWLLALLLGAVALLTRKAGP